MVLSSDSRYVHATAAATTPHTIDPVLEPLSADLAGQGADADFLLQLDLHGFLVVAEETGEGGGEGLALLGALRLS
jgi:hypothetical protein